MEELIAKRYIKALLLDSDIDFMQSATVLFEGLSEAFKDDKFLNIMRSSDVSKNDKSAMLLEIVKPADSEKINNLIKLLVENKRVNIIPFIAQELKKRLALATKTYTGTVYSDSDIDDTVIDNLGNGLSQKYDSNIELSFIKNDFNGIKVEVDDLGIEIDFSKERINNQIIQHIIKAI